MNVTQRVALTNLIDASALLVISQLSKRYSAEEYLEAEANYEEAQTEFIAAESDAELGDELES